MTECIPTLFGFQDLGARQVVAAFDGGKVTSDGGSLLLREVEDKFRFIERFAGCFTDHRDRDLIEHPLVDLLKQRVFGICLGYEDLLDHDRLRHDPLMGVLVGKKDPLGADRVREADRGKPLAGKSTLNRLELTAVGADEDTRYKKIVANLGKVEEFLVDAFLLQHAVPPKRIVLDLDATDDPLHGHQLGRFFNGYYDAYCYLPLYIFCGDHPLCALLRPSDIDASRGALEKVIKIVAWIRRSWPDVVIVLRADSGFCREPIMRWCENNNVHFLFGLAKNTRLRKILGEEMHQAMQQHQQTGEASRVFKDFEYRTRKSWSRSRRVVGKAEHLDKGANPRFVVTSLPATEFDARTLYEQEYCARGDMENRIKEQQLSLFADATCCETMRANQVRLYFSTVAYVVMRALREFGLKDTEMAKAQCGTIRQKLFKIGAIIRVSVRRVIVSLSEAFPFQAIFTKTYENLRKLITPLAIPVPLAEPSG
jgi:hypothetical protein